MNVRAVLVFFTVFPGAFSLLSQSRVEPRNIYERLVCVVPLLSKTLWLPACAD